MQEKAESEIVAKPDFRLRALPASLAVLILLSAAIYHSAPGNAIVMDEVIIRNNPDIAGDFRPSGIFSHGYWHGIASHDPLFRPLSILSLACDRRANLALGLPGDDPRLYRWENIALNGIVAFLMFLLVIHLGLGKQVAWVSSLLFAIHPIHAEAVLSIVGRSELLAAGFGMLFLLAHGIGRWWLSGPLFLLAMFSKESAIAFALVALFCDYYRGRKPKKTIFFLYFLCALSWALIRHRAVGFHMLQPGIHNNPLFYEPWDIRMLTAMLAQARYLGLQILPLDMGFDYSARSIEPLTGIGDPRAIAFFAVFSSALVLILALRRRIPAIPLAAASYAALFLPTSNLIFPIGTIMAERLAFSPSVFFCVAAAALLASARPVLGKTFIPLLFCICAGYGVQSFLLSRVWRSEETLFSHMLRFSPNNAKANFNVAVLRWRQGDTKEALRLMNKAAEIQPFYPALWAGMADLHRNRGERQKALDCYLRAVEQNPDDFTSNFMLGLLYAEAGELVNAALHFRCAAESHPRYVMAWLNFARLKLSLGFPAEALRAYRKALELEPNNEQTKMELSAMERLQEKKK